MILLTDLVMTQDVTRAHNYGTQGGQRPRQLKVGSWALEQEELWVES